MGRSDDSSLDEAFDFEPREGQQLARDHTAHLSKRSPGRCVSQGELQDLSPGAHAPSQVSPGTSSQEMQALGQPCRTGINEGAPEGRALNTSC